MFYTLYIIQQLKKLFVGVLYDKEGEEVLSEEEFQSLKQLKQLKNDYRLKFDEHKILKNEVFYCQKLVDQCRQKLIQGEVHHSIIKIKMLLF